jgi:hypothetical protein
MPEAWQSALRRPSGNRHLTPSELFFQLDPGDDPEGWRSYLDVRCATSNLPCELRRSPRHSPTALGRHPARRGRRDPSCGAARHPASCSRRAPERATSTHLGPQGPPLPTWPDRPPGARSRTTRAITPAAPGRLRAYGPYGPWRFKSSRAHLRKPRKCGVSSTWCRCRLRARARSVLPTWYPWASPRPLHPHGRMPHPG